MANFILFFPAKRTSSTLLHEGKMSAPRGSIVAKLLARMMFRSGLSHLITLDLHQKEIQGFFDCPVDNLRASPFLVSYIRESVRDKHKREWTKKNSTFPFCFFFFFDTLFLSQFFLISHSQHLFIFFLPYTD